MLEPFFEWFQMQPIRAYLLNIAFYIFLVSFSALLANVCKRYVKIMDYASQRSSHKGAVPRSGGIAIVLSFCVGLIVYYIIHEHYFRQDVFWGFFISTMIVALVSLYDDIKGNALLFKVMSQLSGVFILMVFGLVIRELNIPFYGKVQLGIWGYPLTALWIIGFTNAFNFMDGLNGLAAGVATIVGFAFAIIALGNGCGFIFHISYIISASCLGFLFLNYPRGLIFMGDVGSTFLGFGFAAMAILAANYESFHISFMLIPILFLNFIVETFYTFILRIIRGESVFCAHRMHSYQLLHRMGVPSSLVTIMYYLQTCALVFAAFLYMQSSSQSERLFILMTLIFVFSIYFTSIHIRALRKVRF